MLATMSALYLGGTSLAPGLPRYLAAINPWLVVCVAWPLSRFDRSAKRDSQS
jgi:hypothetical protein